MAAFSAIKGGPWLALGLVALMLSSYGIVRAARSSNQPDSTLDYQAFRGHEITLVVLASSTCPACSDPGIAGGYRTAVQWLSAVASERNARLATTGVGIDARPEAAIEYFRKLGPFHELIVGRSWSNVGALRYLWHDYVGPPEVPQFVVLDRMLGGEANSVVRIEEERVMLRLVGLTAIRRWIVAGMPVPR